jgi:hypothetical protein
MVPVHFHFCARPLRHIQCSPDFGRSPWQNGRLFALHRVASNGIRGANSAVPDFGQRAGWANPFGRNPQKSSLILISRGQKTTNPSEPKKIEIEDYFSIKTFSPNKMNFIPVLFHPFSSLHYIM